MLLMLAPSPSRYIAVCFPLVHRDLAHTYSVSTRVAIYAVPVAVVSVLTNVPKFLETRIVVETLATTEEGDDGVAGEVNVTTYTIDVTELRYVMMLFFFPADQDYCYVDVSPVRRTCSTRTILNLI